MIAASGQIFFPGPAVFKRNKLIQIRAAINHGLIVHTNTSSLRLERSCRLRPRFVLCCSNAGCNRFIPVQHVLRPFAHWQTSQPGSANRHMGWSDAAPEGTAFSFPSTFLSVDFSTCVAPLDRK